MSKKPKDKDSENDKPAVTLPATVEKIIPPTPPGEPEKAQIAVEGAEDLYKELRIENTLKDEKGNEVGMKEGSQVEVTIEADPKATEPKKGAGTKDQSTEPVKNKKASN